MRTPLKKALGYSLSVVVGLGILAAVLYYVGWRSVLEEIAALGVLGFLAVAGNVVVTMLAWLLSWKVILHSYGVRLPLGRVIGARLSGYAVSYLTPTLYFGGEPVRALLVVPHTKAPTTRIFATIVLERFLGGLSLILFVLVGSFYALVSPALEAVNKRAILGGVAFVSFWILVGLVNFAGNMKWISRAIGLLRRPFRRWENGIRRAALKVSETEDEIHDAFTIRWKGTAAAFLIQTLATFFVYIRPQLFFHFAGRHAFDFAELSLLFTLNIVLSFILWITPGGVGTSEAALIGIFSLVAIGQGGAVAFSLVFKFVEFILVAIGLIYLLNQGVRHAVKGGRRLRSD